jgi:hypothetical protein
VSSLFGWGGRKSTSPSPSSSSAATDAATPASVASKVLPKVLAALSHVESPAIMDLGPVVGGNIAFFGEELACRIFVEDLFAVVERHTRAGTREALGDEFAARLAREPGSIDGILCWDVFDHLDKVSAPRLAAILTTLLKPGGVLYAFFGSKPEELTCHNRFVVEGRDRMVLRPTPAARSIRHVIVTRDINRMFEGLVVAESVLLKSNARETLFRKPA